jgi:hypothetical protein
MDEIMKKDNDNVRGNRSNLIIAPCFDRETGKIVDAELDISKPFIKYIPVFIFDKSAMSILEKLIK